MFALNSSAIKTAAVSVVLIWVNRMQKQWGDDMLARLYLSETVLQSNGKLGYVQPIGERAIPGQVVDANSTANFGVGAFLLAAAEMYRLVSK